MLDEEINNLGVSLNSNFNYLKFFSRISFKILQMNSKKIYIIIIIFVTFAFWQTLLPNVHVINNFKKSYNIFFTETNSKRNYFSPRQICAIESAALNNPSAKINVYADSAKLHRKWLDKYQNIKPSNNIKITCYIITK